jgi:hypothetical protein
MGSVLTARATGCEEAKAATREISCMLQEIDFVELEAARAAKKAKVATFDAALADMNLANFLAWYWSDEGLYVQDRAKAGRSLAGDYLRVARHYVPTYVQPWPAFAETALRRASFSLIDRFFREVRDAGRASSPGEPLSRTMFDALRDALRGPLNWASARGLCKVVDYKSIVLPEKAERERGLLSDEEVGKILAIPTQQLWKTTLARISHQKQQGFLIFVYNLLYHQQMKTRKETPV